MSPLTLKRASGFFAAGREVEQALALLSDGAFKLFVFLCLYAERRSGRLRFRQSDLARRLGKSPRSITTYLQELQRHGVCEVETAANQHQAGWIEIADRFWPYRKLAAETPASDQASYIEQVRQLFGSRSCVQGTFTAADERLAAEWSQRNVSFEQIQRAYLLGCARKYVALLKQPSAPLISSLRYFVNLLAEASQLSASPSYWQYLARQTDQLERRWRQLNPTPQVAPANFAPPTSGPVAPKQGETR
jgi:DNA-binding HxlR family transcriptional regulator